MKKIGIITGATGGLGIEFVKLLVKEELDELWCIARNTNKLNALKEISNKIVPISLDISIVDNINKLEEMLKVNDAKIKYLVNNASIAKMAKTTDFTQEEILNTISLNITSFTLITQIALKHMDKDSHIINISSQSSYQPVPYINLYASTKAFERSYSLALNRELKGSSIHVTCVTPGFIKTEMLYQEYNGVKVKFPFLADPAKVSKKALRDAKKNKRYSTYGLYVKYMHLLSKISSSRQMMNYWMLGIRKYIKNE